MKNKRLIIILSVFLVLVTLIVLCSTVFTVSTVSFSWRTKKTYLSAYSDDKIAENVQKGKSVFLLNKSEITSNLEVKYPYLQVLKVEVKFPNKLVIHAKERVNMYAVTLEDNKYAILDDTSKVLDIITAEEYDTWDTTKSLKPIVVNVTKNGLPMQLTQNNFKVGYVANVKRVNSVLNNISSTLEDIYWDTETNDQGKTNATIKGHVLNITINIAYCSVVTMKLNTEGMTLQLQNCYTSVDAKLRVGIGVYDAQIADGKTTGKIVVYGTTPADSYYEE